jgi:hypothetical protein
MFNNYTYKNKDIKVNNQKLSVSIYQYHNGMIELSTMIDGYRVKQSYSNMDYSINDALFMFKDYLNEYINLNCPQTI